MTERLGVFGGTFDPPHFGHLAAARAARRVAALDRVLFVPAGRPWQKSDRAVSSAEDRYRMTQLAIRDDEPAFAVSRVEVDRPGPSYTVDTLEALDRDGRDLFLVLGADAAAGIDTWHMPGRVCDLAVLAVVNRPESASPPARPGCRTVDVDMEPVAVSATEVRRRLRAGLDVSGLLPEQVAEYAQQRGLYGGR
ncbi:MAG: nicotinate-nucleotide adenylyltransferase [Acidimicrobiia bacterium]|nr:nicotinate-nucleotide adenylyltransferase [Acidimicrobiia bacterium]